ncbi:lipoyl(octanoyl) transferase [Ruminiclostridium sufflavum DSM 19573]|uniref:Octanoyltransferase n=1 Tax=Ruminiclostridium sufflavum DSM 19573 TaxID=1121337 RepID=A0A318XI69_9FIRM|nr:lipoyl(octanoyl) transferase LipB [Ruminiclostridium sufflavum]PYG84955.1 lipoyl(octanoyl) transferase [Ruminiclostridium sufflavum DSM 19573]
MKLQILRISRSSYESVLHLQEKLFELRMDNKIEDTLILTEHEPVYTLGRRGKEENILVDRSVLEREKIKVISIGRGGDIMYHVPGQIVGYPILDLKEHGKNIRKYVENIELLGIRLLKECFQIDAHTEEGHNTGVWVQDKKIMAIGIEIRRYITMHGFALNVDIDMKYPSWIYPCGIKDRGVTSIQQLVGKPVNQEAVYQKIGSLFGEIFSYDEISTKELEVEGNIR